MTRLRSLLCKLGLHTRVDWEKGSWHQGPQAGLCLHCRRFVVRR